MCCFCLERGKRAQKVYIRSIYSIKHIFDKKRLVSLGYPLGMFGVSFGAISCLDRESMYQSLCRLRVNVFQLCFRCVSIVFQMCFKCVLMWFFIKKVRRIFAYMQKKL